jgi:hypothetical protein
MRSTPSRSVSIDVALVRKRDAAASPEARAPISSLSGWLVTMWPARLTILATVLAGVTVHDQRCQRM